MSFVYLLHCSLSRSFYLLLSTLFTLLFHSLLSLSVTLCVSVSLPLCLFASLSLSLSVSLTVSICLCLLSSPFDRFFMMQLSHLKIKWFLQYCNNIFILQFNIDANGLRVGQSNGSNTILSLRSRPLASLKIGVNTFPIQITDQGSISPTFYELLFCMKVLRGFSVLLYSLCLH